MDEVCMSCVICQEVGADVKLFTDETLQKCSNILQIRIKNKLKYHDVKLPSAISTVEGYHTKCYSRFVALKNRYFIAGSAETHQPSSSTSNVTQHRQAAGSPRGMIPVDNRPCTPINVGSPRGMMTAGTRPCTPKNVGSPSWMAKYSVEVSTQTPTKQDGKDSMNPKKTDATTQTPTKKKLVCFICRKGPIKIKNEICQLSRVTDMDKFKESLKATAERLNDEAMITQITELQNETVAYHRPCKLGYCNKGRKGMDSGSQTNRQTGKNTTDWQNRRSHHQLAFQELSNSMLQLVFEKKRCFLLKSLTLMYKNVLSRIMRESGVDMHETQTVVDKVTNQFVREKILKSYPKTISATLVRSHYIIGPPDVTVDEDTLDSLLAEQRNPAQEVASGLREVIFQIEKNPLPAKPSAEDLINGECAIPEELLKFLKNVIVGDKHKPNTEHKWARKVESIAEDIIYATRSGRVKTAKHIMLGMAMKSLTNSRKVVEILNRYGHCCSYNALEEMETEITFASSERLGLCPDGIERSPDLNTGVAFDNFDRFVETRSGKDTLHDTVGIIFQNKKVTSTDDDSSHPVDTHSATTSVDCETPVMRKRKRRSFEAITPELESYPKKPRMVDTLIPANHELRQLIPDHLTSVRKIDMIWMMCHALQLPNTPMWVGFNSNLLEDVSVTQTVKYLTPMNESPTNVSVVLETLSQAQKVAEECSQKYAQVTYDLAIAKIALQIQATEAPRFDNVFIHLGSFHIMMAYFKAVGKLIEECGLTYLMVESDLLASGSINGFISGTHFNRCKRLHPLVALAIEVLHFKAFLRDAHEDTELETVVAELETLQQTKIVAGESPSVRPNGALALVMDKYSQYKDATENGDHGKTPQFYMKYVKFVNYYLNLSRSIRTGDFELFRYCLPKISNLFFVVNQPNYARWLVKYHDNLMQVEKTHPGLQTALQQGSFGVKRTGKSFSKQPVDLTLEQTVNADASRQWTAMTNSIAARQRWAKSHALRAILISAVLEHTGLKRSQDVTAELEIHNMSKNTAALQRLLDSFKNVMDPFNKDIDKNNLINIASGKATSCDIADFLLNAESIGEKLRETFINECASDSSRFERPVKRQSVRTFAAGGAKVTMTLGTKVQEVKMQRDLFARMLAVALDQKVDAAKILSYPLTPVPMSLCHLDGTLCKTDKSSLMRTLQRRIKSDPPKIVDVLLVDGVFMLHLMKDVPKTFGNISKKFLQMVLQTSAPTVYVLFDQYKSPSIKDIERTRRAGVNDRMYTISGPDQVRPSDFGKELRNQHFKEALIQFFISHWKDNEVCAFIGTKTVYLDFDRCYRYQSVNNTIQTSIDPCQSTAWHEEADTKVAFHICNMNVQEDDNVIVRCSDTDILVILLGNFNKIEQPVNIWLDVGVGNNQRVIDVSALHRDLGDSISRALPGFHALTGCDYNPAFFRKGKTRPFNIMLKNLGYQQAFANLGKYDNSMSDQQHVFKVLENFVCELYGLPSCLSVDEARIMIFSKAYEVRDVNEPFMKRFKNVDASAFPPCHSELAQQLLRAQYISSLWVHAHMQRPTDLDPQEYGWKKENGKLELLWFDGQQCPPLVNDVIIQPTQPVGNEEEGDAASTTETGEELDEEGSISEEETSCFSEDETSFSEEEE